MSFPFSPASFRGLLSDLNTRTLALRQKEPRRVLRQFPRPAAMGRFLQLAPVLAFQSSPLQKKKDRKRSELACHICSFFLHGVSSSVKRSSDRVAHVHSTPACFPACHGISELFLRAFRKAHAVLPSGFPYPERGSSPKNMHTVFADFEHQLSPMSWVLNPLERLKQTHSLQRPKKGAARKDDEAENGWPFWV